MFAQWSHLYKKTAICIKYQVVAYISYICCLYVIILIASSAVTRQLGQQNW